MATRKEEEWYKKFLDGALMVKGWRARTREILKSFSAEEQALLSDQLARLGEKIGREWSRENDVRRIDTPMLQTWGDGLLLAKKKGARAVMEKIDAIENEVDGLLG